MVTIKIIVASTRPARFGMQPANWLAQIGEAYAETARIEIVDLQKINLPFLDVETSPLHSTSQNPHQIAWAKIISEADGFIIVTPEYNHSYPAPLKNAIDYLYKEWGHKPVAFLGYGAEAGGARAIEHLREIASWLGMYDISTTLLLREYYRKLDAAGEYKFSEEEVAKVKTMLEQLILWAETMRPVRAKLQSSR